MGFSTLLLSIVEGFLSLAIRCDLLRKVKWPFKRLISDLQHKESKGHFESPGR